MHGRFIRGRSVDLISAVITLGNAVEIILEICCDPRHVLVPPEPQGIQRDIHHHAVGVGIIGKGLLGKQSGRSIIFRVFGAHAGDWVSAAGDVVPAGFCRFQPERPVFRVCPFHEQRIEMGQMIAGIGKIRFRHKTDHMIAFIPHGPPAGDDFRLMNAVPQYFSGLGGIRENALSITPAGGSHEKRHGKVFLPVRGRTFGIVLAVQLYRPGKVSFVYPVCMIHVAHGKLPKPVKQILPIHLHTHHHTVAHALGAGIDIAGIHHAAAVSIHILIDFLLGIKKERIKAAFHPLLGFRIAYPDAGKMIGISPFHCHDLQKTFEQESYFDCPFSFSSRVSSS